MSAPTTLALGEGGVGGYDEFTEMTNRSRVASAGTATTQLRLGIYSGFVTIKGLMN